QSGRRTRSGGTGDRHSSPAHERSEVRHANGGKRVAGDQCDAFVERACRGSGGKAPSAKAPRTSEAKCATRTEANMSPAINATRLSRERVGGLGAKPPDLNRCTSEARCATRTEANVSPAINATRLPRERVGGLGAKPPALKRRARAKRSAPRERRQTCRRRSMRRVCRESV